MSKSSNRMERNPDHQVGGRQQSKKPKKEPTSWVKDREVHSRRETRAEYISRLQRHMQEAGRGHGYGASVEEIHQLQRHEFRIGDWQIRCHEVGYSGDHREYRFDMVGVLGGIYARNPQSRHFRVVLSDIEIYNNDGLINAVEEALEAQINPEAYRVYRQILEQMSSHLPAGQMFGKAMRDICKAMGFEFAKMSSGMQDFGEAVRKAQSQFEDMVKSGKVDLNSDFTFADVRTETPRSAYRFQKIFDMEDCLRVVYKDSEGEILAHKLDSLDDVWLAVEYLIGEDCEPLTVMDGEQVLAGRPQSSSLNIDILESMMYDPRQRNAEYHEYWVTEVGVTSVTIPDDYPSRPATSAEAPFVVGRQRSSETGIRYQIDEEGNILDDDDQW